MKDAKLQYYSVKIQRKKAEEKLAQLYKDATCVVESRKKGVSFDDIVHICKLPNRQTVLGRLNRPIFLDRFLGLLYLL